MLQNRTPSLRQRYRIAVTLIRRRSIKRRRMASVSVTVTMFLMMITGWIRHVSHKNQKERKYIYVYISFLCLNLLCNAAFKDFDKVIPANQWVHQMENFYYVLTKNKLTKKRRKKKFFFLITINIFTTAQRVGSSEATGYWESSSERDRDVRNWKWRGIWSQFKMMEAFIFLLLFLFVV